MDEQWRALHITLVLKNVPWVCSGSVRRFNPGSHSCHQAPVQNARYIGRVERVSQSSEVPQTEHRPLQFTMGKHPDGSVVKLYAKDPQTRLEGCDRLSTCSNLAPG